MDKTPGLTVVSAQTDTHKYMTHTVGCTCHKSWPLAFFASTYSLFLSDTHAHEHTNVHKHHEKPILRLLPAVKVKLVNQTAIPVDTSSLRAMKDLDDQRAAEPTVLPQPHSQDLWWESRQETLPLGLEPLQRCTLSSSRGSKPVRENRSD